MAKKELRFGVIGCGLMGREFASAAARWLHLLDLEFEPKIVAVCDANPPAMEWFRKSVPSVVKTSSDYRALLDDRNIDAIYCAVPHNLHQQLYVDIISSGKSLLGEKPFGMDKKANDAINTAIGSNPDVLVRCSSEFPFYPGAYKISQWMREGKFGKIIDAEAGFWHSSDLDPRKQINWKRMIFMNGEYGCMGDLGLHVLHLPLRYGWKPKNVRALLAKIVTERPDKNGKMVACETWDNATLACEASADGYTFPFVASMKRIAPGHGNTWFIRINGTKLSAEFSTRNPKQVAYLPYSPGDEQSWRLLDVSYSSAYPAITGGIFEFGFSDSILQMWAAFCDEMANGEKMKQPFRCATPEEASETHRLFTAALESQRTSQTVSLN